MKGPVPAPPAARRTLVVFVVAITALDLTLGLTGPSTTGWAGPYAGVALQLVSTLSLLVLYRWLLAGKVGFRLCRAYIVGTMLLAALIPALDVPLYSPAPEPAAEGTAVLHEFRGNLLQEDGGYGGATAEDAAATELEAMVRRRIWVCWRMERWFGGGIGISRAWSRV